MDIHQIKRLLYTIRHLKLIQVYYQLKYRLIKSKRVDVSYDGEFKKIDLIAFPSKFTSYILSEQKESFEFLNIKHSFPIEKIDWSFLQYGLLWTYNLNYFDWLHQKEMTIDVGVDSLSRFYSQVDKNPIALHPYPTSLRIINVSKFVTKWGVKKSKLFSDIVGDLKFLSSRLEYHLLANHLLENAFALYIGGLVTAQEFYARKGRKLLKEQLEEQILDDGMHYERSPMYHLIILERLLDAYNFAKATNDELASFLKEYVIKMVAFAINWQGLDRFPMMQDSAYGISIPTFQLLEYAKILLGDNYPVSAVKPNPSGYRILEDENFHLFVNVGNISPSYQPGHAHADEFTFELFHLGKPIIVDTGISTYEKNSRRQFERSTEAHNTIRVDRKDSSEVWSGFRVAKRAKVMSLKEGEDYIKASHDGYKGIGAKYTRQFKKVSNGFVVDDLIESKKSHLIESVLYFHPNCNIRLEKNCLWVDDNIVVRIANTIKLELEGYNYPTGFNMFEKSIRMRAVVEKKSKIEISYLD
jgi:hypothetical protein